MAASTLPPGVEPNKPVQISAEWWVAYSPEGHQYYHNTVTQETTWTKPEIDVETKVMDQQAYAAYQQAMGLGQEPASLGGQCNGQYSMDQMSTQLVPMSYANGTMAVHRTPGAEGEPEITIQGSGQIPAPWTCFEDVKLHDALVQPMVAAGFSKPTPIQAHAWPILITGRDMIGIAKTGSGKTLSFLLPGFAKTMMERRHQSPLMLVMAPTRELACQIDADAKKFGCCAEIRTALAYGGAPKGPQLGQIQRRPHLLTGTPGRLNDFLEARSISLGEVRFLILDEADRMLDMGFEPQIRKVIAHVPTRRQTLMFTATWPKEVRAMARDFFNNPIEVRIGNADELQANADIDQKIIICNSPREKDTAVVSILRNAPGQVIIFTATKRMCESLSRSLERMGVPCEAIHGDKDQHARDMALAAFKGGRAAVLVATDVAARGLDVKSIRVVINYDPAGNAEDYVHRIGRTGRAGMTGDAYTLLTSEDGNKARQIMEVMQRTGKPIPQELQMLASRGGGGGGKGGGKHRDRRRSRSRSPRGGGGRGTFYQF